jgi:hypothetical protein
MQCHIDLEEVLADTWMPRGMQVLMELDRAPRVMLSGAVRCSAFDNRIP